MDETPSVGNGAQAGGGRFVVLQNFNDFFAALEIVNIKDDRSAVDELTFRY